VFADLLAVVAPAAGYNTAVVLAGTTLLGAGGGVIGVFVLLRRRALIGDAISHGTLPGVGIAFLLGVALWGDGRVPWLLMVGAALTGALGILAVQWIRDHTRLPEDTAIGTVLSVFYGLGIVLLSHIQTLDVGGRAGLGSFLLGATASMSRGEAETIAVAAAAVVTVALLFYKEFRLVCFDPEFAAAQGLPVSRIDLVMMLLLLAIVAIGLRTVGLVLIIAIVIVPPVAARFWTDRLGRMVAVAAVGGGLSAGVGALLSAALPKVPAGAVIVLVAGAFFVLSLLFAPARGVLAAAIGHGLFRWRMARRQVLAALAEGAVPAGGAMRASLRLEGLLAADGAPTGRGRRAGLAARRDRRLWDRYLRDHPDEALAAGGRVGLAVERVLPADLVRELERRVEAEEGRGLPA